MKLLAQHDVRELGQGRLLSRWLIAVAALALSTSWAHSQDFLKTGTPVVVVTTDGLVMGLEDEHVKSFRGIPYAAPPINELRFRPAAAPAKWTYPRDARVSGAACPKRWRDSLYPLLARNRYRWFLRRSTCYLPQ